MDYIRKLPLLMSLTAAFITGAVGHSHKVPNKENTLKMLIVLIVFYIVGYLVRETVLSTLKAVEQKNEEEKKTADELMKEKGREKSEQNRKAARDKGKDANAKRDDHVSTNTEEKGFQALQAANIIKEELRQ